MSLLKIATGLLLLFGSGNGRTRGDSVPLDPRTRECRDRKLPEPLEQARALDACSGTFCPKPDRTEPEDQIAMNEEVPSAGALIRSHKEGRARISPAVVLAGALVTLVGATWFQNRQGEAALRERTAKRLRPSTKAD
jgi:hypothetical protein